MTIFNDEIKLPDRLTITQIVKIKYPDPKTQAEKEDNVLMAELTAKRQKLTATLEDACRAGDIKYEGELASCQDAQYDPYRRTLPEHFPLTNHGPSGFWIKYQIHHKSTCTIHKTEFKQFLQKFPGEWPPVNYWLPLANWLTDGEHKAVAMGMLAQVAKTRENQIRALKIMINGL